MGIFQVADKGLNCARNIYAATKEADDGYIFSKSIHGRKNKIRKMADKASNYATYKAMTREELGDFTKYVKISSKDKNGEKIKPVVEIDKEKINEDLKYAGYNLMVTSELDMEPLQVYQTYHCLWKIEESFRITKSYLNARPVYVQKKKQSMGIF